MNTPGIPPDVQTWLQQNPQLQQMLSAVQQQGQPTTNPDGTPGAPKGFDMQQQPQQATNGMVPFASGIWAKPGMTTSGIWGGGPAGTNPV